MVNKLDVPTLCAQCQGGRLIGQAVHERDFGWRYFLACADCEAKLELGRESAFVYTQPSVEVQAATGAGRKCSLPDCTTILSAYNTTTACWAHTVPSFK